MADVWEALAKVDGFAEGSSIFSDDDADLALILELAELTAAAHRPPPGVTAKPPPTGADLARRRKFH